MKHAERILAVLLTALLAVLTAASLLPAMAEEQGMSTVLEATVRVSGTVPGTADTYTVRLEALDGAPMPPEAEDGVITVSREGAGKVTLATLTFEELGMYRYKVTQDSGSHPSAVHYSDEVYTVVIYILNNVDGPVYTIYDGNMEKVTEIVFEDEYAETSVTAKKVWDDEDNQDGKRQDVTLILTGTYTDGTGTPQTVKLPDPEREIAYDAAGEDLSAKWERLPVYCGGYPVTYTVSEQGAVTKDGKTVIVMKDGAEYTVRIEGDAESGFTVTNSHTPEEVEAAVMKVWNDASDQDGIRPDKLMAFLSDGRAVTLTEDNGWYFVVSGLPKYEHGEEIEYFWTEDVDIPGYELTDVSKVGTLTIFTNTHETSKTVATVRKVWIDGENQDAIRPESLTVTLSDDQEDTEDWTVVLSESNLWTATLEGLEEYAGGRKIVYTWTEEDVDGYTLTGTETQGTVTVLTNTHETETVSVEVEKVWVDGENENDTRPESITVTLSDGTVVTLNEDSDWKATVEGLPKYDHSRTPIEYTWTEAAIAGYDLAATVTEGLVTTLTNKIHDPEDVTVSGKKTWIDGGKTHDNPSEITLTLERTAHGVTETVDAAPVWSKDTYTYSGLDKYDDDGYEYTYTVTETQVEGYDAPEMSGYNITNRLHDPEDVTVSGKKTWIDGGKTHDNPSEITLTLTRKAHGRTEQVDATPVWSGDTYTYSGLEKYDADGYEYTYTVTETQVTGYDAPEMSGYDITNRIHDPMDVEIGVVKVWEDADDRDGKRPTELTVTLSDGREDTEDRTVTLSEDNGWKATLTGLPRYDADGAEIEYTWTEPAVTGYTVETSTEGKITTLTNTHVPEMITISVQKNWAGDIPFRSVTRPDSVGVTLMRGIMGDDGKIAESEKIREIELDEDNNWSWSSEEGELPRYESGKEIVYWFEEADVTGYTLREPGDPQVIDKPGKPVEYRFNLFNDMDTMELVVKKEWDDNHNKKKTRPSTLTVTLTGTVGKDTVITQKYTLKDNGKDTWSLTVVVPKCDKDGKEISYSWTETVPAGYRRVGPAHGTTQGNVTTFTNKKTSGGGGSPVYKLTIYYVYEDGTTAAETYVHTYHAGDEYSVTSPIIPGYTASITVVEGIMPAHDVTVTVVYVTGGGTEDDLPGFGPIVINEGDCLE